MKLHTLIIDDDTILLFLVKKMLEKANWIAPYLTFENGTTAIAYLNEHYNQEDSFVIFLDINMPIMNGWDFLAEIEKLGAMDKTFIFILSSSINNDDRLKAFSHKLVVDFISKPISMQSLVSIKEFINKRPL